MTATVETSPVRALPVNTVISVAGVSFRQDTVKSVVEGDEVRIRHDSTNEYDANACEVVTPDGRQLGFVPAALSPRLAGAHPGGVWLAKVTEVYRKETWGLRVKLGPLVDSAAGRVAPGLRHRGDGTIEAADGAVALTQAAEPEDSQEQLQEASVYAKSGRLLGALIKVEDTRVRVRTQSGATATYPKAVVEVRSAA